jgi:hypothetical protein
VLKRNAFWGILADQEAALRVAMDRRSQVEDAAAQATAAREGGTGAGVGRGGRVGETMEARLAMGRRAIQKPLSVFH